MSNKNLSPDENRFIDDIAALLVPWGVPQMAARIYGYFLLQTEPVSLDQIAEDLEISKSSASVAARLLERYSLARRHGERGSKRVLYEMSENYAGFMVEQSKLLGEIGNLLKSRASIVSSKSATRQLKDMGEFFLTMHEVMERVMQQGVPSSRR